MLWAGRTDGSLLNSDSFYRTVAPPPMGANTSVTSRRAGLYIGPDMKIVWEGLP